MSSSTLVPQELSEWSIEGFPSVVYIAMTGALSLIMHFGTQDPPADGLACFSSATEAETAGRLLLRVACQAIEMKIDEARAFAKVLAQRTAVTALIMAEVTNEAVIIGTVHYVV